MIDRTELYEVYKKEQAYQKTADHFGVSRQRIEMLLRKCPDAEVVRIQASKRDKVHKDCLICLRPYTRIAYKDNGKCSSCNAYLRIHPSGIGKAIRPLLYPKNCSKCGCEIGVHNRVSGKCKI